MIRKIKAEDKEIYIKMAHDFYRMPAVDHPVPDSYLEKTFEECLKSDTYAELFILEMGRQDRRLWTDRQDLFAGSRRDGVLAGRTLYIRRVSFQRTWK